MSEAVERARWRPTRTTLIAGGIVVAGFWLMNVSWWFFLLVGIGALGPGFLREVGLLEDKDEFQRGADHRAGYHAFLAVGALAFFLVAWVRSGEREIRDPQEMATLLLSLLWFTWLLSSLIAYWGSRRAAAWILRIFGSAVLIFTVVSNLGSEWTGWLALLMHPLLAAPFFILAWTAGRWPRVTGVLLLGVSAFFFYWFDWFGGNLGQMSAGGTTVLFLGPLLAGGIALLSAGKESEE